MDIFNPFIIEMSVTTQPRVVAPGNGNETLEDLSGFPIVLVTGTSQIQVRPYLIEFFVAQAT